MISDRLKAALLNKYSDGSTQLVKKAFRLLEGFDAGRISPEIEAIFAAGNRVLETTVMFADLANFSLTVQNMSNLQIRAFLDKYYKDTLPAIFANNGEIEKLIGDGIIAVFGPPFCEYEAGLESAASTAMRLVRAGIDSGRSIKIALRTGPAVFTYVGDDTYSEPTMIGSVLTEVFRLEGVAKSDSISTYAGTDECAMLERYVKGLPISSDLPKYLVGVSEESVELRGVDFDKVKHFQWELRKFPPVSWKSRR